MAQARMPLDPVSPAAAKPAPKPVSRLAKFLLEPWKRMLRRRGITTVHYLTKTEAHTFAFSVAANASLAFFPFMLPIMGVVRKRVQPQKQAGQTQYPHHGPGKCPGRGPPHR